MREAPLSHSASTDEATTKNTSHDTTIALPPDADSDNDDSDHVAGMHSNAMVTRAPRCWTPEEDVKLTVHLRIPPPQEEMGQGGQDRLGCTCSCRIHSGSNEKSSVMTDGETSLFTALTRRRDIRVHGQKTTIAS